MTSRLNCNPRQLLIALMILTSMFQEAKLSAQVPKTKPIELRSGESITISEPLAAANKKPSYFTSHPDRLAAYEFPGEYLLWSSEFSDFTQSGIKYQGTTLIKGDSPSSTLEFVIKILDRKPSSNYKLTVSYTTTPKNIFDFEKRDQGSIIFNTSISDFNINPFHAFFKKGASSNPGGSKFRNLGETITVEHISLISPLTFACGMRGGWDSCEMWENDNLFKTWLDFNQLNDFELGDVTIKIEEIPQSYLLSTRSSLNTNLDYPIKYCEQPIQHPLQPQTSRAPKDYLRCRIDANSSSDFQRPTKTNNEFINSLSYFLLINYDYFCDYNDEAPIAKLDLYDNKGYLNSYNFKLGTSNEFRISRNMNRKGRLDFSFTKYGLIHKDCNISIKSHLAILHTDPLKRYVAGIIKRLDMAFNLQTALLKAKVQPDFIIFADLPNYLQSQIDQVDYLLSLTTDPAEAESLAAKKLQLNLMLEKANQALVNIKQCDGTEFAFCSELVEEAEAINAADIQETMNELREINSFVQAEVKRLTQQGSQLEAGLMSALESDIANALAKAK